MTYLKQAIFIMTLAISVSTKANTVCENLAQCQQAVQTGLYQHWKARYNYPGASVTLMVKNDLQGNVEVDVTKSSGFDKFDQSAVEALRQSLMQLEPQNLNEQDMIKLKAFQLNLSAE